MLKDDKGKPIWLFIWSNLLSQFTILHQQYSQLGTTLLKDVWTGIHQFNPHISYSSDTGKGNPESCVLNQITLPKKPSISFWMTFLPYFFKDGGIIIGSYLWLQLNMCTYPDFSHKSHLPLYLFFKINCQSFLVHSVNINIKLTGVVFLWPSSIELKQNKSVKLQNTVKVNFLLVCGWALKLKNTHCFTD